jgi:hypothetical protein
MALNDLNQLFHEKQMICLLDGNNAKNCTFMVIGFIGAGAFALAFFIYQASLNLR